MQERLTSAQENEIGIAPGIFDDKVVKEWTPADIYDLQCLQEEIPALQRIVNNEDGKWNAEMVRQCRKELQLKKPL